MLGVALVVGFVGGAALAAEPHVDSTVQVDAVEIAQDVEADRAIVTRIEIADIVRDSYECRSLVARRATTAPDFVPAVPPPRA